MASSVVPFLRRVLSHDWTPQELAEFYRVESALLQAGLQVSSDRGVTDEGDPWFVFYRPQDDEVIAHFARIGGRYVISAPACGDTVTGHDFRAMVRGLLEGNAVLQTMRRQDNVTLHPSALLVVLVASMLLKMAHPAEAAPERHAGEPSGAGDRTTPRLHVALPDHATDTAAQDLQQMAVVMSAVAFVTAPQPDTMPTLVVTAAAQDASSASHSFAQLHGLQLRLDEPEPHHGGTSLTPSPSVTEHATILHDATAQVPAVETVPAASAAAAVASGPVSGTTTIGAWSGAVPPAQPIVTEAVATLVHHFSPASAPDLADGLLSAFGGNTAISFQNALPAALVSSLSTSRHATHTVNSTPAVSLPGTTAGGATDVADHAQLASPAGAAHLADDSSPAVAVAPGGSVSQGTGQGSLLSSSDIPIVLAEMQAFSKIVGSNLEVVVTSNQVIAFDAHVVDHAPASVASVTYDFVDGSSICLLGSPSELPHAFHV